MALPIWRQHGASGNLSKPKTAGRRAFRKVRTPKLCIAGARAGDMERLAVRCNPCSVRLRRSFFVAAFRATAALQAGYDTSYLLSN